jgi:hypothetical protein
MNEVTGGWRKLHNEELHSLYPSPMGPSQKDEMGCVTHGAKRNVYRILVGKRKRKRKREHQEDLDIGGRIILKWILEWYYWVLWTD